MSKRGGREGKKGILPFWNVTWSGVFVIVLIIFFALLPVIGNSRLVNTFFYIMMMIVVSVSFRLLFMTGMLSVAQGTFLLVGAYTTAILCTKLGWNMWMAFPFAFIVPAAISFPIAVACLRLGGFYLLVITGGLADMFVLACINWQNFLGGLTGISGIPAMPSITLFGKTIDFVVYIGNGRANYFYVALIFLVLSLLVLWRMEAGRMVNITDHSIRQNKNLASSVGVWVGKYRTFNFVLSCGWAGLAGAFLAHYYNYIDPQTHLSGMSILRYLIVGGRDSFVGPIVGAIFLPFITEYFRAFKTYNTIALNITLIIFIAWIPGGLMSIPDRLRARFGKSTRKTIIPPQWI